MDGAHLADLAGAHDLPHTLPLGMHPVHERFHDEDPGPLRVADGAFRLLGVKGEGLLAQDVLPGVSRLAHPFRVQVIGQRDVHRLHRAVFQKLLVGPVGAAEAEVAAGSLGPLACARGDGGKIHRRGCAHIRVDPQPIVIGQ